MTDDNVYLVQAHECYARAVGMPITKEREQLLACAQVAALIAIAEELQYGNQKEQATVRSIEAGEKEAVEIDKRYFELTTPVGLQPIEDEATAPAIPSTVAKAEPAALPYGLKYGKTNKE
jgi:hypothetical protein